VVVAGNEEKSLGTGLGILFKPTAARLMVAVEFDVPSAVANAIHEEDVHDMNTAMMSWLLNIFFWYFK
jgi:hypothetical protein